MPNYNVKVTYLYPVSAVSPQDALSTVPMVIKGRFIGFHGEGTTEVIDQDGNVVLKAELVTLPNKTGNLSLLWPRATLGQRRLY